jgi:glutamate 5-kinase
MTTKLMAARIAADAGCATLIAAGRSMETGRSFGTGARSTLIEPATTVQAAYKQWIGGSLAPRGELVVDSGCADALLEGKSLLAVGLVSATGAFGKGDPVAILDPGGAEIARGLVRYDAGDLSKITGVRSADLAAALGYEGGPVVVHADDLALRRA